MAAAPKIIVIGGALNDQPRGALQASGIIYEHGRISSHVMADIARERAESTLEHGDASLNPNSRRRNCQLLVPDKSSRISAQSLENYNRKGTGEPPKRRAEALRREQHRAQELQHFREWITRERKTREIL